MMIHPVKKMEAVEKAPCLNELDILLKSLDVKYIFSYDDEWDNEKLEEEAEENKKKLIALNYSEFSSKFAIKILDPEETYLLNEDLSTVDEILNSTAKEIERLKKMFLKAINKERESNPLIMLKSVLDKVESSKQVSVKTFANRFDLTNVKDVDGRILFLLDMNMGESDQEKDVVIKTIIDINKSRPNSHDIAVVYSHEKLEMYKKHDTKVSYVESYLEQNNLSLHPDNEASKYLIPFQLWAISKGEADGELIKTITSTLEKAAFGYSLHDYLEKKHEITQKATLNLIKLPEETFEVLYGDSFVEGEIFLDVLERTHQSVLNKVEFEAVRSNPQIYENLLSVSKMKNEKISTEIKAQGIKKYRNNIAKKKTDPSIFEGLPEYGLINYTINATYTDIMTGDVFVFDTYESSDKKYGILVTTDCDLPIRPKGNEIKECGRNSKLVTLLLCDCLVFSTTDGKAKEKIEDGEGLWPVILNGEHCLLIPDTKNTLLTIDSMILDLCSLNSEGWAELPVDIAAIESFKTYYFNEYYKNNLSNWIENVDKLTTYIPDNITLPDVAAASSGEKLDDHTQRLVNIMAGLKYTVRLSLENRKFEIKRVGRLETRRTLQLIQTKVNHMSRIGLTSIPGA
ncbi:hypothetical protein ACIFOE_17875 [Paenibacillus sp. NRS-1783]|uniref:hypothetical protein n=1 Tax=Paenibacillus sp. NRS-1783 TaxID=3233907 RepID=UPI003D28A023